VRISFRVRLRIEANNNQLPRVTPTDKKSSPRVDRSCVTVPPDDPIYKIALSAPRVVPTTTTAGSNTSATAGTGGAKVKKTVTIAESSDGHSGSSGSSSGSVMKSFNDMVIHDDDGDYYYDDGDEGNADGLGGGSVGGVWMPPVGGKAGPWGSAQSGLKIAGQGRPGGPTVDGKL
jgi:hypothetical protein